MKSPDDPKHWIKEEEPAQVMYVIGLYIMDGFGPSQIARKLKERKILTPAAYYESKGMKTNVKKQGDPYAWDSSTIADMMDRWREYLGHTVNFKTRKKSYKSKKTIQNPESEWPSLRIPMNLSGRRQWPMRPGWQDRPGAARQRWEKWGCSAL